MKNIKTKWFHDTLREKNLSVRGLGRHLGVDASAASLMLRGKRNIQIDELPKIAAFMGASLADVLKRVGLDVRTSRPVKIPVIGRVDEAGVIEFTESSESIRLSTDMPPGVKALRAETASSPAEIFDGWLFIVKPDSKMEDCVVASLCMVEPSGAKAPSIAYVRPGYAEGRYNLTLLNGERSRDVDLKSASPVLFIQTR